MNIRNSKLSAGPAATSAVYLLPFALLLGWALTGSPLTVAAQSANTTDPLMVLMQSQPPIITAPPKQALAAFDPPIVHVGEEATYRITLDALLDSITWPEQLPTPNGLSLRPSARGQIFRQIGATLQPHSAFNYRARSEQPGTYSVPEFTVQAYGQKVTIPAARLEVVPAGVTTTPAGTRLQLEMPLTNLFAGQSVTARVRQSATEPAAIQGLTQVELIGDGILVDRSFTQQRIEGTSGKGSNRLSFIHETTLIPLRAGNITVTAQGFESASPFNGPIALPGEPAGFRLADSDPVTIRVRPLPKEGELPGFTGGIGHFTIDPPLLATNVLRVGEPVQLTVTVRGQGNLGRLMRPVPNPTSEWQIFSENSETSPALIRARGFVTFRYSLIPTSAATRATPRLPFSFFDPARVAYVDLTIPALRVTVKPSAQPMDTQAVAFAESPMADAVEEPALSELATHPGITATSLVPMALREWFPLVQVTPVFGFLGLWAWDRRRRYLETHPDILVRRRARRVLRQARRALRAAMRDADAIKLVNSGLAAMRAAAAPHFPAEPRALVGADVLALLTDQERQGKIGETVRQLFAAADAARFDTHSAGGPDLPAAPADIERLLNRLEAML